MKNEYRSISIPVLFVQGIQDFSSPVESVYHIRDTFGSDTYSCWFREMGHISVGLVINSFSNILTVIFFQRILVAVPKS